MNRVTYVDFRKRHGIPKLELVTERIDTSAIERLEAFAAEARAEMGEERWAELSVEWREGR